MLFVQAAAGFRNRCFVGYKREVLGHGTYAVLHMVTDVDTHVHT